MKTLTIKKSFTFEVPEGSNLNILELSEAFTQAVRIWGIVNGLELIGGGGFDYDVKNYIKTDVKAKKAA